MDTNKEQTIINLLKERDRFFYLAEAECNPAVKALWNNKKKLVEEEILKLRMYPQG